MTRSRIGRSWWLAGLLALICTAPAVAQEATPQPAPDLAEEHWPYGIAMPAGLTPTSMKGTQTPILAWVPPGAKHIRAIFIIMINSDSKIVGEHAAIRDVAAKQEMGIIYLRYNLHKDLADGANLKTTQTILDAVAEKTGIPEFRYAPWITLGKSASGKFPFFMAWAFPQRTIATISYHAETPTWPVENWAKLNGESILHVNVNGQDEWGGTWHRHVRPSLLNYRAQKGWLTHQAIAYGVGHGDYPDGHGSPGWGKPFPDRITCIKIWDYLALYIDKAIEARVPKGVYATNGPVQLKQVDEASGYLIDPRAVEELFGVPYFVLEKGADGYVVDPKKGIATEAGAGSLAAPYIHKASDVPAADRKKMFWVPDRELAEAWLKLHDVRGEHLSDGK